MDIEMLVAEAKNGDDEAFYILIKARKEILYKTAFAFVKNQDDALDIISDTVLKAYTSLKGLKKASFFYTWLTRILVNTAKDCLKKKKKVLLINEVREFSADKANDKDETIDLFEAIDKLNATYKTIVILKYFDDMTINEIAKIMACPVGTVKTNLHKALKELRIELREDYLNERQSQPI